MKFSHSAISSFQSCPRSFEYRYVQKKPESFVSVERHMGGCVHEAIRWAYEERRCGRIPRADDVVQRFTVAWGEGDLDRIRVVKPGFTLDGYAETGRAMVRDFSERVFPGDHSETLWLEERFDMDLEPGVVYCGILDRLSRQTSGRLRITDFKTGRVGHPLDDLQLPSYSLHVFTRFEDEDLELCLEDLQGQRDVIVPFQRAQAPDVRGRILSEIKSIQSCREFATRPSILCRWCGYNDVCDNPHPSVAGLERPPDSSPVTPTDPVDTDPHACPECGSPLRKRKGRFGDFWGCSAYPECQFTLDIRSENPEEIPGEEICPECGARLRLRNGRYGRFWGCSAYPRCRFTRDEEGRTKT